MRLLLCLALLAVFVAAKKKKPHGSSTPASPAAMASGPVNSVDFPVVLPPYYKPQLGPKYNVSASNPKNFGNCLLYLEGVTVIVQNDKSTPSFAAATIGGSDNVTHTYLFNENDVQCQVNSRNSTAANNTRGEYTFNIAMVLGGDVNAVIDKDTYFTIKKGDKVEFELQFNTTSPQYWELTQVTLKSVKINQAGQKPKFIETEYISYTGSLSQKPSAMNVNSVYGYGYGCSDTQGVFFPVNVSGTEYHIGLALHNFQVELYGLYRDEKKGIVQFSRNVNDCIPTFSVGSAMGIVVALVLASVLMFGFLMLNSVQTMDRFDDPKQKQIVINVKE
ncbi:hypothetical protein L596_004389 [Steinernema carpocapsae]|nr:hypothetical protein L596_004389 [Steinernema carpocapsae]